MLILAFAKQNLMALSGKLISCFILVYLSSSEAAIKFASLKIAADVSA
jgi:hypothetical protein